MLKKLLILSLLGISLFPLKGFAFERNINIETAPIKFSPGDESNDFYNLENKEVDINTKPNVILINKLDIPQKNYTLQCDSEECELKNIQERL